MGSSPVTATKAPTSSAPASLAPISFPSVDSLVARLGACLARQPLRVERLGVAYSGGSDSTALLAAASRLPGVTTVALHVDHGLDPASADRCQAAARLAGRLGVVFVSRRVRVERGWRESPEESSRRARYEALEELARGHGLQRVALGHHLDDQAETLLLRWLAGSGIVGLAAMRESTGLWLRPLLCARRAQLAGAVAELGLTAIEDPSNQDLAIPRNRIRHQVVQRLGLADPASTLGRLADRSRAAVAKVDAVLERRLGPRPEIGGASIDLAATRSLPGALVPFALGILARRAGRPTPLRATVRAELRTILGDPRRRLRVDAGEGWRLESHARRLCLLAPGIEPKPFAYTLSVPGSLEIEEITTRVRLHPAPPGAALQGPRARWVLIGVRSGVDHRVVVRSRRPGDHLRPLNSDRTRPLGTLLIDRRVRRDLRDRLPLFEIDGELAWVPGVTIGESFRPDRAGRELWILEAVGRDGAGGGAPETP